MVRAVSTYQTYEAADAAAPAALAEFPFKTGAAAPSTSPSLPPGAGARQCLSRLEPVHRPQSCSSFKTSWKRRMSWRRKETSFFLVIVLRDQTWSVLQLQHGESGAVSRGMLSPTAGRKAAKRL